MKKVNRKQYAKYFEEKLREGEKVPFVCCKDNAPDDLQVLVRDIHETFDSTPNDWIYREILEAFEALESCDMQKIAIDSDIYHSDLYNWLRNSFAAWQCDEILSEGEGFATIYDIIGCGQYRMRERIYNAVNDFIEEGGANGKEN